MKKAILGFLIQAVIFGSFLSGCSSSGQERSKAGTAVPENNIGSDVSDSSEQSGISYTDEEISAMIEALPKSADEYYGRYTNIVSVSKTDKEKMQSGTEIMQILTERGFDTDSLITNYDENGSYSEEDMLIADVPQAKHPLYKTPYISETEILWTVYVINGAVFAWPALYNLDAERDTPLMLSETDTVISYDGTTNQYYETIPRGDSLTVIKVNRIDKETLDKLTPEEMNRS